MKRLLFFTLFLLVTLHPILANAYPSIISLSGTCVDGEPIGISGSGFGSHNLDIEWLGGSSGNIEQGVSDSAFSKAGWSRDGDNTAFYPPKYTKAKAHSGSKSIVSQYPLVSHYCSGFAYDHGSKFGVIYATWWVYFEHVDSQGQWKKWRLSPTRDWNNQNGEFVRFDFYKADGSCLQALIIDYCRLEDSSICYPNGDARLRWTPCNPTNNWNREEIYAEESSAPGVADGTFVMNLHTQSAPVENKTNWIGNVITRAASVLARWQWMQFQNYWGNIEGGGGTREKIYYDDIYLQFGTQARVEIGDSLEWAACRHREIQVPSAWSDGSIKITVNQGSFQDGQTAYLFVVDSDGNVNSTGFPIVIGGGSGNAQPRPAKNLRVLAD